MDQTGGDIAGEKATRLKGFDSQGQKAASASPRRWHDNDPSTDREEANTQSNRINGWHKEFCAGTDRI
jgi:hypothetical protein